MVSSPSLSLPGSQTLCNIPLPRLPFEMSKADSAQVPQDILTTVQPDDVLEVDGTSLPQLCDDSDQGNSTHMISDQEFSFTPFDVDSEAAVASMLNTKLEFSDTLAEREQLRGPDCGRWGRSGGEPRRAW